MKENEMDSQRAKLFEKLLELICELDRVCLKYGIQYFAAGGTALGAVRHKGFIPWDDDVDIYLLRSDYNRLKEHADEFRAPFFLQNPETDPGYPKCFCRLRNSNTTAIPYDDVAMKCNLGIFIDIFPLDRFPNSKLKRNFQICELRMIRLLLNSHARQYSGFGASGTSWQKAAFYYALYPVFQLGILTPKRLFRRFERVAARYEHMASDCIGDLACSFGADKVMFSCVIFECGVEYLPFETINIPVSKAYHQMLTHQYGDYMKPVKAPSDHGEMVFSTEIPYATYFKDHEDELRKEWYKRTEVGKRNQ